MNPLPPASPPLPPGQPPPPRPPLPPQKNILFIMVDDLRPQLGCYGATETITPNIDALAADSVLFENAYCQVPTCGASRASLLTGMYATPTRFIQFDTYAEREAPGIPDLPGTLKNAGYTTISNGKIYHQRSDHASSWHEICGHGFPKIFPSPDHNFDGVCEYRFHMCCMEDSTDPVPPAGWVDGELTPTGDYYRPSPSPPGWQRGWGRRTEEAANGTDTEAWATCPAACTSGESDCACAADAAQYETSAASSDPLEAARRAEELAGPVEEDDKEPAYSFEVDPLAGRRTEQQETDYYFELNPEERPPRPWGVRAADPRAGWGTGVPAWIWTEEIDDGMVTPSGGLYPDGKMTAKVINDMHKCKAAGTPCFLTAGCAHPPPPPLLPPARFRRHV